jgi:hypothetical protein
MAKVFFSYSHKDETMRVELETHLALLKREGKIEAWHDRRIGAGKELSTEIDSNLEASDIILLLVSHYFLASYCCYEVELQRALEKHNNGEARLIPVILEPCDWQHSIFRHLLAVPKDGKPVSKYPNRHDALLEVVHAIRDAVEEMEGNRRPSPRAEATKRTGTIVDRPRSSNLRIKKTFTEQEKDEFLEQCYEYIANHFEGSLAELETRYDQIGTKFKRIDANHFTATIYKHGKTVSECKVWLGDRSGFSGGIAYASSSSTNDNSWNESASVEDDGYSLFLKPMGMSSMWHGDHGRELLSQQGAAEYFWEMLIRPLQ